MQSTIKVTTTDVWATYKERSKQTTAAQNLLAKITSKKMIKATNATAQAIAKATENTNYLQSLNLNSNLRISNLEYQLENMNKKPTKS
jgi:hypothetical protein